MWEGIKLKIKVKTGSIVQFSDRKHRVIVLIDLSHTYIQRIFVKHRYIT